jgi:hypothetical protein
MPPESLGGISPRGDIRGWPSGEGGETLPNNLQAGGRWPRVASYRPEAGGQGLPGGWDAESNRVQAILLSAPPTDTRE